jgi:hypothetical protein
MTTTRIHLHILGLPVAPSAAPWLIAAPSAERPPGVSLLNPGPGIVPSVPDHREKRALVRGLPRRSAPDVLEG